MDYTTWDEDYVDDSIPGTEGYWSGLIAEDEARERDEADYEARLAQDEDPSAYPAFCFVCSRATDHWGEHDALVDAGLAEYHEDGSVTKTAAWDADKASEIAQAEFEAYMASIA